MTAEVDDLFQLTRLLRGVTYLSTLSRWYTTHISTHTPLARRDAAGADATSVTVISTHTPLARRDSDLFVTTAT